MDSDFLISMLVVAIGVLLLFFRTNISLGIMALCVGYVLGDLVSGSIVDFVYSSNLDESTLPFTSAITIFLILLPAGLVVWRFKGYQKGRYVQHLLPAGAFALLATLFVLLNMPFEQQRELAANSVVYDRFISNQVLIVVAAVGLAIFDVLVHTKEQQRKLKRQSRRSKD